MCRLNLKKKFVNVKLIKNIKFLLRMKRIPARCEGEHTPLKMVSSLTLNKYSIDLFTITLFALARFIRCFKRKYMEIDSESILKHDYFYWSMIISMVIILQRFLSTISTYILFIIRSSVYLKSKKVNQCKRQNGNYAIYSFVALVSNDCSILNNDCIHYFYFFLKMFQLLLNIVWFIMKKYMQVFYSFKKKIASKSVSWLE